MIRLSPPRVVYRDRAMYLTEAANLAAGGTFSDPSGWWIYEGETLPAPVEHDSRDTTANERRIASNRMLPKTQNTVLRSTRCSQDGVADGRAVETQSPAHSLVGTHQPNC